ncbi:MAG: serine/threonine protein phosphatase [Sphingopyxis sp.]|nr:serine/threonine protein phosphatase [Sphingopyxis sp.]
MFRRGAAAPQFPVPAVPDGRRVYAIGDIHGRDDLFADLIDRIAADDAERGASDTTIVLLGDLIDRGPDSAAVVERTCRLMAQHGNVRLLSANHEEVFLKALGGSVEALRFFCRIGGEETIWSYGITGDSYRQMSFEELLPALQTAVPGHHVALLKAAEDWVQIGDYVFVHAGIRPGTMMDSQKPSDLRWIREAFLDDPRWHGAMVVHGHTITDDIDVQPNRLGIDTGAYASGKLTAVGLEGTERWFLTT